MFLFFFSRSQCHIVSIVSLGCNSFERENRRRLDGITGSGVGLHCWPSTSSGRYAAWRSRLLTHKWTFKFKHVHGSRMDQYDFGTWKLLPIPSDVFPGNNIIFRVYIYKSLNDKILRCRSIEYPPKKWWYCRVRDRKKKLGRERRPTVCQRGR